MNKKILILTATALVTFGHNAWAECALKYSYSGSNATVTGASECDGQSITIPLTTTKDGKEYKVTKITSQAFIGNKTITGITFETDSKGNSNITSIGGWAFSSASGVTGKLKIPESVTSIETGAFYGMKGVTGELKLPDGVTFIGDQAFSGMSGVTGELKIPESITSIETGAFSGMSGVTSLFIPESVTSIGSYAFRNNALTDVFLAEDSPLTDDMLKSANISLNKIVRYTAEGQYLKDGKVYANLEDYRAGIALSCKEGSTKCKKRIRTVCR